MNYCLELEMMYVCTFSLCLWQNDLNGKRRKISGSRNENKDSRAEIEASSAANNKPAEPSSKPSEPPMQDYIHVRSRRGQATDSHSLAERVICLSPL